MPIVLGLTGLPCSGKSTVSKFLSSKNVPILDADFIASNLLNEKSIRDSIQSSFGSQYVVNDTVNKPLLAKLVFNDFNQLDTLEAILLPHVLSHIHNFLNTTPEPFVVLDAPLLHQFNLQTLCKTVWRVEAPLNTRLQRAIQRGWTIERFHKTIERQMSKPYASDNDIVIYNDSDYIALENTISELWNTFIKQRLK